MVIGFVTKLVKTITLQRVFVWTLAMIVSLISYTVFEHRADLVNTPGLLTNGNLVGATFDVSDDTKAKVSDFVQSDPEIVGAAILSADIRLNARTAIFYYGEGQNARVDDRLTRQIIDHLPLFTKNEENNRQIVKLINGEFFCAPYSTSTLAAASPDLNKNVVSVCRASLPPYYGHFSGFVTVFLRADPDVEKQVRLKSQIEQLATEIYFRDVVPTTHKTRM